MTIDTSTLKVGDKVRLRNGEIRTVIQLDKDDEFLPFAIDAEHGKNWYYASGMFYDDGREDPADIIDTDPEPDDEPATDDSTPLIKSIHLEEPSRPTPFCVTDRNLIIATGIGTQQFASIECNGKRYVPSDCPSLFTGKPFSFVTREGEGIVGLIYDEVKYTPADSWPEPIIDRAPTKEDADEDGDIQRFTAGGWMCEKVGQYSAEFWEGWQHTPAWEPERPKPPNPKQEALAALDALLEHCTDNTGEAIIRQALEGME